MKKRTTILISLALCAVMIMAVAFTAQADDVVTEVSSESSAAETESGSESEEEVSQEESTEESSVSEDSSVTGETQEEVTDEEIQETEDMNGVEENGAVVEDTSVQEEPEAAEEISEDESEGETVPEVKDGMKITLVNETDISYSEVYVRPSMTENWSGNLLDEGYEWLSGEEAVMYVPDGFNESELGLFDIKTVSLDGTSTEIIFVPLIEDVSGNLYISEGIALVSIQDKRIEAEEEYVTTEEIIQDHEVAKEALKQALVEEVSNI